MYQKSISEFFSKGPNPPIARPKRVSASNPKKTTATKLFKEEALPAEVQARIVANRAAARAKLLARAASRNSGVVDFGAALEPSWKQALSDTIAEGFWKTLSTFVGDERRGHCVYPAPEKVFSAFNHSSFVRTKVVIIGQDPYHGPKQAHGMSFSVPEGVYHPPSLQNIFRELTNDIPTFQKPGSGCLEKWANQGVLLLNSVLTVRKGQPQSHRGRGWERFTDAVVMALNEREGAGVVFMLWGGYAKKKGASIDRRKHCVLSSVHPSPLSANRGGWFGNHHFSKANKFLEKSKQDPIDWKL